MSSGRAGAGYDALPGPRHRFSRWQRRDHGPRGGQTDFPSISAYDQAEVLRRVVEHLGHRVRCMRSSAPPTAAWSRWRSPNAVRELVRTSSSISAADRAHPMSTAWRSVQRAIVRYRVEEGRRPRRFAPRTCAGDGDLSQLRGIRRRASRRPATRSTGGFSFPVESYCWRVAMRTPRRISRKHSCACRSRSICIGSMRRGSTCRRRWSRSAKISSCRWRTCGRCSDGSADRPKLVELSSLYGHDAFLKEATRCAACFARALRSAETRHELTHYHADDACGARRARIRHATRRGGAAAPPDLDVCVQGVRREGRLRLHALRQSDARCARRGASPSSKAARARS